MNDEIKIPISYIDQWIADHYDYINTRPIRFMVQDYKHNVLKKKAHKTYHEQVVERKENEHI